MIRHDLNLKPCPFCGSEDIEFIEACKPCNRQALVYCPSCGVGIEGDDSAMNTVVEDWNHRPLEGKLGTLAKANEFEKKARKVHDIWSHWMKHMLSERCGISPGSGAALLYASQVKKWRKQMHTDYQDLSEDEKESDRKMVRQFGL